MKIKRIWAENVRNIKEQVSVVPVLDGVTVLHAPNEFGKTSLAEVILTLFTKEHTSNHSSLKLLQRADATSGPTMGVEFVLGEETYSLEKTWLRGKNCTLQKLSPRKVNFSVGEESESELANLKKQYFDEVLWRIIQVGQGSSAATFDSLSSAEESTFLQQAFDRATESESSESEETFLQALTKEYFDWFTDKGKPRREKDSRGKLLVDKIAEIVELSDEISDLESRLKDAERFEKEARKDTQSVENLEAIQAIQQKNKELERVSRIVNNLESLKSRIKNLVSENPYVTTWDKEKFEDYRSASAGFEAFKALPTLKISALKEFEVNVDGESTTLTAGETKEIPITSGLSIEIDEVAQLDFPSGSESSNLKHQHDLFISLGRELEVSNIREARERDAKATEWQKLQAEMNSAESAPNLQEEIEVFKSLSSEKESSLQAWSEAIAHRPISQTELLAMTREGGKKEGRYEEIRSEGVLSRKDRCEARTRTLESEIEELELQRDGIDLLWRTINDHKERKAASYSVKFEEELNKLVGQLFPGTTNITVDSDFTISERNQDGTVLGIDQLSIGAKEQLSFLSRLAIARIASSEGPIPLILDDDLVSTDNRRLKAIGKILEDLKEIQVLIFTCHPERFKDFPNAKSIDLEKV